LVLWLEIEAGGRDVVDVELLLADLCGLPETSALNLGDL